VFSVCIRRRSQRLLHDILLRDTADNCRIHCGWSCSNFIKVAVLASSASAFFIRHALSIVNWCASIRLLIFPRVNSSQLSIDASCWIHTWTELFPLLQRKLQFAWNYRASTSTVNKNSSWDEIANVNFLRRYRTRIPQNTKKENLFRLTN